MSWGKGARSKLGHQEIAEQVLQIYTKSLQDHKSLKSILSDCCVLDYFGKIFSGQEKVLTHLFTNLHDSNFELSSLSFSDQPSVKWKPIQNHLDNDLGVILISPPKFTFPSVTFSTPIRSFTQSRKRTASEASIDECSEHCKSEGSGRQSSSSENSGTVVRLVGNFSILAAKDDANQNTLFSPQAIQTMFHRDIRYLTAYGTIRYPKRVYHSMDLKRFKQHSQIAVQGRFCQLSLGFECDELGLSVTNCKIQTIKYSFSSRVTPRNLLKAFNDVDNS